MYTSVVEKSPGRKIEGKQYVVLRSSGGIANYHVHHDSDSDHAAQYWWPIKQGKGIADQFDSSLEMDGMFSPFPYCGRVARWNDGMMAMRWSSLYLF